MQGRLELGGARRHPAAGTHARVCMHARTYAVGTQWAMQQLSCTAWNSGQAGAWGCAQTRPCARVFAPGRRLTLTRCAPCALSQLGWQGETLPYKAYTGVATSPASKCVYVTLRTRALPFFSVARNAPPNLSSNRRVQSCHLRR